MKLVLVAAFALVLPLMSCASAPALSSHGVDYAPSFNPNEVSAGEDPRTNFCSPLAMSVSAIMRCDPCGRR
jgi:hypothetical protein